MPTQAPLAYARHGERVPDSQIVTQGPFSSELSQPAFQAPKAKPSGFGGPGDALLSFVNNFLQGASEGRLRQFQQSEQTKKEHERNFDATVQHIMDSPEFTKEFKERAYQNALMIKASAGKAALGGGKGGKNDHPLVGMARSVFDGIVGPSENVKHGDITSDHVSQLISEMQNPANKFNLAATVTGATQQINDIIERRRMGAAKVDAGQQITQGADQAAAVASTAMGMPAVTPAPPTAPRAPVGYYQEDAQADPEIQAALGPLRQQGFEPFSMPSIATAFGSLPKRPTPAQLLAQQTQQARIAQYGKSSDYYKYLQDKAEQPAPGNFVSLDEDGNVVNHGFIHYANGKPLDAGNNPIDPATLKGARKISTAEEVAALKGEIAARNAKPFADNSGRMWQWDPQAESKSGMGAYRRVPIAEGEPALVMETKADIARIQESGKTGRAGMVRPTTPPQAQARKVKTIVGALQMQYPNNLEGALAEARTVLAADPEAFADVSKALKNAYPKPKKADKPSALEELRKRSAGGAQPQAATPVATPTAAPPGAVQPAVAPVALKIGDVVMFNGKPLTYPKTGQPVRRGDKMKGGGEVIGVAPDGQLEIEQ